MSLLSRVFFSGRTPVTAQQLGEACARQALRAALEGEDSLAERLERIGVPLRERDELVIFALVPFDRVLAERYAEPGAPVRSAMCECASAALCAEHPGPILGGEGRTGARFAERLERYAQLLAAAEPGEGPQLLAEHAYAAIARRAAPAADGAQRYLDATLVLAEFFLAARVQTLDGLRRFTLIRGS